jgi:hypothetical protein
VTFYKKLEKMSDTINLQNPLFQSPYTYCQAVGSNGNDGSVAGVHLRWDFLRALDIHLPKGNLSGSQGAYPSTSGFNKNNDFVTIYKAPFNDNFRVVVDFVNTAPTLLTEVYNERIWEYRNLTPISFNTNHLTHVRLEFTNIASYDALKTTINPNQNPSAFLKAYNDVVKISTIGKSKFRAIFDIGIIPITAGSTFFQVEAVSLVHHKFDEPNLNKKLLVSARKSLSQTDGLEKRTITGENINHFRYKARNRFISKIYLYTYEDYIVGNNGDHHGNYEEIGQFSLSLQESVVFDRLEDSSSFVVDESWPKYNDCNVNTGAFTVKVNNYENRWQHPEGIGYGVERYLELSPTDPLATEYIASDEEDNQALSQFSFLKMLKLVSLDYHIARMMGLGTIDPEVDRDGAFYVMEYTTEVAIEGIVPAQTTTHLFMTLPTTEVDNRLPVAPNFDIIDYGLFVENGTDTPSQLTDDDGYTPFADERFINLRRSAFVYENDLTPFFVENTEFELSKETQPIGFGVEYKHDLENNYRIPELNHDSEYLDPAGIPETIFCPNTGPGLVMQHRETEEGIHQYALYSINWFSRASGLSTQRQTDETLFPKRNTILPPTNLAVQLIQEEDPLIFTTSLEQNKLSEIQNTDKTLVRATFEWNYSQHRAYQRGTYAEFFYNGNLPKSVRGKITNVQHLNETTVQVTTGSFIIQSTNPATEIQPVILPNHTDKFIGSSLVAGQNAYIVESVSSSENGINPTFVLKKIKQTSASEFNNDNIFTVAQNYIAPQVNDVFMVVENLTNENNWDSALNQKVYLEPFYDNHSISISGSSSFANNKSYKILDAYENNGSTVIKVRESFIATTPTGMGSIQYFKRFKAEKTPQSANKFSILGDFTSEFTSSDQLVLVGAGNEDGLYDIVESSFDNTNTEVTLDIGTLNVEYEVFLFLIKTIAISSVDISEKEITVASNILDELNIPHIEQEYNVETEDATKVIGGIFEQASIIELEDKDENGNLVPNSRTGVFEIIFNNFQLENHIHPEVDWYKGVVRISEDSSYLPTDIEPNRTIPQIKKLEIWHIDRTGSTLKLIAFDSTIRIDENYNPIESYVPISTGSNVDVNYHPAYKVYLTEDSQNGNNFNESTILPLVNEGSRQSLIGIRAIDSFAGAELASHITTPAILLAQEISEPLAPGIPTGPSIATRPNFYGKSTYTFDVAIDTTGGRQPHCLVFYRANEQTVLDQLYKTETVEQILTDLANLDEEDAAFFNDRWNDLLNLSLDNEGLFKQYIEDGFRFPNPDNDLYQVPQMNFGATPITPFASEPNPETVIEELRAAINEVFLPLTEQPVIYSYINEGYQTRGTKPVLRDNDGQVLTMNDPAFDPSPMAVKFEDNNTQYVRFTDYTLDGASSNFYFYFAVEMSNQMKISSNSPVSGPILLVNAAAPEQPAIRKTTTRVAVPVLQITDAVRFEINDYVASDGIKQVDIYRANNPSDSRSIRTMQLVKTVDFGDELIDDFENDEFPLYGDPLFYRIIAKRKILNEQGEVEFVPSKPSDLVLTNVVDGKNPLSPELTFEVGNQTAQELENVVLKWPRTCYNGTYRLQRMNQFGNWVQIYEVKSNELEMQYPPLIEGTTDPDFVNFEETVLLPLFDSDEDRVYYRYRVQVENSSGLFNLSEKDLVVGIL